MTDTKSTLKFQNHLNKMTIKTSHLLSVLIADDEILARQRIRDLLADIGIKNIVGEAKNGQEAVEMTSQLLPDLLLLDISMPLMDGIEAAEHLNKLEQKPHIIFTTAYDNFAIQAFEVNAIDYLLKPIGRERLQASINRIIHLKSSLETSQIQALMPLRNTRSHISISERGRILLLPIENIIYFRAELKYITVRTLEKEYLLEESLTKLEEDLGQRFIRLHRNCLVAYAYIAGFEKVLNEKNESHWVALLKNVPETIIISRRQQSLIREISSKSSGI